MTRTMYDSITPGNIPSSATMVAGYADGRYANLRAMKARFPHATIVSIAVRWTTRAQVLDVETGDATPTQAVQWCTQTMADTSNHLLTVYCNTSEWPHVRAAFQNAGVTEPNYWVAQYDNNPSIPAGAVAKQYQGDTHGYDVSSVAAYWPGVDPAPPTGTPQWRKLLDHVMSVPEQVYEHWTAAVGWDNVTAWGTEYGEQGVSWCVIWNWCMFHDVGLDSIVLKTDNVTNFSNWAKARGQWSEFPSVGAWVNFDDGGHTEIVIGFDADNVYTKGGNSIQAGSQDRGQGNGVWSHEELRRATRVTGYFAPRFTDNVCPPTADPNDPRGGTAVTSYFPEDLMPLSDADVQKVATASAMAVLGYKNADALKKNPGLPDVYGYIAGTNGAVASLTAQVGALSAVVTALSKAGGLTVEQATAAAEAGAKAALEELAAAIGKAGA